MTYATSVGAQCDGNFFTYTSLCDLDSVIVEAIPLSGEPPFTYIWSTGETSQQIVVPNQIADYLVTVTDANGCSFVVFCHIKHWPDPVFFPFTDTACEGDSIWYFLNWIRNELPGLQYEWSTGEVTDSIIVTDNVTLTVTVTDPATGCEVVFGPESVAFDDRPEPEIVGPNSLCDGGPITLTVEGGPFFYVEWYPIFSIEESITVTDPGTYWVNAYYFDNPWCVGTDSILITEGIIELPLIDAPPELCDGQSGPVTLTNHQAYETYIWSNGETAYSFLAEEPGTYIVTVTDQAGCMAIESITIEIAPVNELSTIITSANCGLANGGIELGNSLPGNYSYGWSNGANSQDLVQVLSGIYSVTVTDDNGCFSTLEVEIPEEELTIILNETIAPNTSCINFNGSIGINILPEENYTIVWSNGDNTDEIIELASGTYSVTVSLGDCQEIETYFVDDISAPADLLYTITSPSCGESNGAIDLQLNGGTSPFTFLWSSGETSEDINGIGAGLYTVTVTGSDGCLAVAQVDVDAGMDSISIEEIILPNTSCTDYNGSISLTLMPEENYTFLWSNGYTTEDLENLASGIYTVTITYGNSCQEIESYVIDDISAAPDLQYSITSPTCGGSNGEIDIQLLGGSSPFTYLWSTGEISEDLNGVEAGLYSITVSAADGCNTVSDIELIDAEILISIESIIQSNTSCTQPDGNIDVTISPLDTYTILWSTGATTEDLSGLSQGVYIITVSQGECTISDTFQILNENNPFTISSSATPNTSCISPNGAIDLNITPTGNYDYIWSNGWSEEDLHSLTEGQYTVTVTDVNGCSMTSTFEIETNATLFFLSGISIANTSCQVYNGSIDMSVTPPDLAYNYLWSSGATTQDIQNLSPGNYSVTVTNFEGCMQDTFFTVSDQSAPFMLSAISYPDTSCIQPSGSLDLSVSPAGMYFFSWSTGANTEDILSLSSGSYSVTVSDSFSSCTSTAVFEIDNHAILPNITYLLTHEKCGKDNGAIDITVSPAPVEYIWSHGATTEDISGLTGGIYYLTVTISNGCTAYDTFTIMDDSLNLDITGNVIDNTLCMGANGSIVVATVPAGNYLYQWSNGASEAELQFLEGGTYSVTVTDQYQCTQIDSFIVGNSQIVPELDATIISATCGQSNGSVDIQVSLSIASTFMWSNNHTGEDLLAAPAGMYSVTVTSQEGCSAVMVVEIPDQNTNFSINSDITDNTSCSIPSGSIDVTVTPAGAYFFQWSTGEISEDIVSLGSGEYGITVTDQFNCAASELFTIENLSAPPILSYFVHSALCGLDNGTIELIVSPPSSLHQFLWSTGGDNRNLENLDEGVYSVTVTDAMGCTADTTIAVPGTELLLPSIDADLLSVPNGGNIHCTLNLNVPLSSIYSISWSPGDIMSCREFLCMEQNISIAAPTEVAVLVTDTNGCTGEAFLLLKIENDHHVYIPNIIMPDGHGANTHFTIFTNDHVEEVVKLEIFDRWGNCVFLHEFFPPNEPSLGWNGSFKGKTLDPAVFVYRAIVRFENGEEQRYQGDVTLIR